MATYDELLAKITQQEEAARTANLQRYDQAMAIYDEIISRYRPGGEFGKAALGQLEKRKVKDVGKETQQLISSGLYGTTTMGATGRRWEESVGAPERLRLEDIQMQRLSQAQMGKAGFMERREDIGPDTDLVAQLSQHIGAGAGAGEAISQMGTQRTIGGTYGASSFPDQFSLPSGRSTATGQTVKGTGVRGSQQYGGVPTTDVSDITAQPEVTETIKGNTTFGRWAMNVAGMAGDSKVGGKQLEQLKAGFTEYMRWQRGGDLYKAAVAGSGKSYGGYSAGAAPAPAPKKPTYRRGYPAAM